MEFLRAHWSSSTLVEQNLSVEGHSDTDERTHAILHHEKVTKTSRFPSKKPRLDFANTLQIHVGIEGCFLVPQNRITQRSEFFREYCLKHETDGEEMLVVELPDEDRFLFDIYLQVVYQDDVILPLHVDEADDPHWSIRAMIQTYMLADKLKDMSSCNIIVDNLIDFCASQDLVLVSDDWNLIFKGDYEGSILRKLAVDFCVIATQPDFLKTQMRQMPTEMAIDCVGRFADLRLEMLMSVSRSDTVTSLADLDRCKHYHQHSKTCPPCLSSSPAELETETLASRRDSPVNSEFSSSAGSYYSAQQQQ